MSEECPLKRKLSSLDAWIKEVILWDGSNTEKDPGLIAKKYLKFLDSVYKSKGYSVENESFVNIKQEPGASSELKLSPLEPGYLLQ